MWRMLKDLASYERVWSSLIAASQMSTITVHRLLQYDMIFSTLQELTTKDT